MGTIPQTRALPRRVFVLAAATVVTTAVGATRAEAPARLRVGGHTLEQVGSATRSRFFGLVRLYEVALYLPHGIRERAALRDNHLAKALHVTVIYRGSLPDDVPAAWQNALKPALDDVQWNTLRRAYTNLQGGDEIRVTYAPVAGTAVTTGRTSVLELSGPRLMNAFLEVWLGDTPVSEDVKRDLLSSLPAR